MKRTLATILAVILALGLALSAAAAEDEWADYTCAEEKFATRIPVSGTTVYEEGSGMTIYTEVPGYIPYVIIHRRTGDMKFKNPVNYLNNVYREYLEDKYGSDSRGMNPASTWEAGGRELIGARYMYSISGYPIVQIQLIDVRDAGDVEYTIKYIEGDDTATMAAVNEAVRSYRETDTAAETAMEPSGEQAFEHALTALLLGETPEEEAAAEGAYEEIVKTETEAAPEPEPQTGEPAFEDVLSALLGNAEDETAAEEDIVRTEPAAEAIPEDVPEPAEATFEDVLNALLAGGEDEPVAEEEDIVKNEAEPEPEPEPAPTSLEEILAGLLSTETEETAVGEEYAEIVKTDKEESEAAAASAPDLGTQAPEFLVPAEFTARFNELMGVLADRYTDYLGEDNAKVLKEEYTLTQEDIQGVFAYYDNNDWSLEAGFLYTSEEDADFALPALTMNFSIRKDTPEIPAYFAGYILQMMIAYEYQDEVSLDDLAAWFENAEPMGESFPLPDGYTLSLADVGEHLSYAILTENNPYLLEQE